MKEPSIMRTCAHLIKDMLATHNDSQYHCACLVKRLTQHKSDFKEKHLHKNFVFHKLATHGEGCEKSQFVAFWCLYQSVSTIIIEGICAKKGIYCFWGPLPFFCSIKQNLALLTCLPRKSHHYLPGLTQSLFLRNMCANCFIHWGIIIYWCHYLNLEWPP